jgi:UDP-N-acetylglucosamine 2-epimerase (non-hydrolysing)
MSPLSVILVFGTRPEAIKMIPVLRALTSYPDRYRVQVCITAQHREMLDQVLDLFGVTADFDLNLMRAGQDLSDITSRVLNGLRPLFADLRPDLILVHGDTTTTAAASLAAYYAQVPIAHVEAGLRSFDNYSPWPEEVNRRIADILSILHFAPTETARRNLLAENVPKSGISITGNTSIDALLAVQAQIGLTQATPGRRLLVTAHRRENFGEGIVQICSALRVLAVRYPDLEIQFPVHPNPHVRWPVERLLSGISNLHLLQPMDYFSFVRAMFNATLILSDSGGVQEEAPAFGKPVLVMRDTTERPEAIEAGTAMLVGTDSDRIVRAVSLLLEDANHYEAMALARNPYGDGAAALRIESAIHAWSSAGKGSPFTEMIQ